MIKIPLFKVYMSSDVDKPLLETIHSGWIGEGDKCKEFEQLISNRVENPYCLFISTGTHALQLALVDAGAQLGRSVISTSLTCFATTTAILQTSADIIWADIKRDTLNIDSKEVRNKIRADTIAICCMSWGGTPADLEELRKIADEYNIKLIEDAAQGIGSSYKGSPTGKCQYAHYSVVSLQAIKSLTAIEGGLLFLDNEKSYKDSKLRRWYSISREGLQRDLKCESPIFLAGGGKYNGNDVHAVIAIENLKKLDTLLEIAQSNVNFYRENLSDMDGITLLQNDTDRISTNWIFTVLVENLVGFGEWMGECGIHVSKVHNRNDLHPLVAKYKCHLPNVDYVSQRMVAIPVGWWVTKEDREYIVDCIKNGW
jgi:dTDP-4-amino-4,6-dideoxygalactose transaminase